MENLLLYIIIVFLLLDYFTARILDYLNGTRWSAKLPVRLKGFYDEDRYKKSQAYDRAKQKLAFYSGTFNLLIILAMLLLGGFALLDVYVRSFTETPIWMTLLFFCILFFAADILNMPFSIYGTFVIEERFGFNKSTSKTFIFDKIKSYLLTIIIGGSLLSAFVWFYEWAGTDFWIYTWLVLVLVTLFFLSFYTSLIVPLFNKLTPLKKGELRTAIEQYCKTVNFSLKNVYIIDGSKRSTKANAYFSGIGSRKSIVLFDTLVEDYSTDELVAVLAHEVGHYKKKHTLKNFILSSIQNLLMLFVLSWLIENPALAAALKSDQQSFHMGLIAFALLYTPISTVTGLLMNVLSRKYEYQADRYVKSTSDTQALKKALKKLSVDNLSNMDPHPAYVFFYYSHPPILQRLDALGK